MTIGGTTSVQGPIASDGRPRTVRMTAVRKDDPNRVSEVPVAALASVPLITVPEAKTLRAAGNVSPSQMFEPLIADASERRRANRKVDARANRQPSAYRSQLDKEAVEAKRPAPPTLGRTGGATKPPNGTIETGQSSGTPPDQPQTSDRTIRTDQIPDAAGRFRPATKTADPPNASGRIGRSGEARVDGPPPATDANVPVAPTAGTRPVASTGAESPVAQQVARILGAARSNGAEATRTTATNPVDGNGRTASEQPDSAGRTAPSRRSGKAPSASPTDRLNAGGRSEFDQLVRSLRMQIGTRRSSAKIHLDPPELGRLFVDVRLTDGNVQVDIRTETEKARMLLHERAGLLRTALEEAGLHIDRFEVRANFAAHQSPGSAGGYDGGGGADLPTRSDGHAPGDRGAPGAAVPLRDDGVASVESERDEVVRIGMERRLDLRI